MVNKTIFKPEITVFAGPNGSGKSTITDLLKPPYDYVNADEIKKCFDKTHQPPAPNLGGLRYTLFVI